MKSIKLMGVALVALAVMGSAASIASAAEFKSTEAKTEVSGVQEKGNVHEITIEGTSALKCKSATFLTSGAVKFPTTTLTVTPTYASCEAFGFTEAQTAVSMDGCVYELQQPNVNLEGDLAIRCPAGNAITIKTTGKISNCEVLIPEAGNTSLRFVQYKNNGGTPSKVGVEFAVTGIQSKVTETGVFCPLTLGEKKNGTYKGKSVMEDKNAKAGLSVS